VIADGEAAEELDVRGASGGVAEQLAHGAGARGRWQPAADRRIEIERAVAGEHHRARDGGHRLGQRGDVEPGALVDEAAGRGQPPRHAGAEPRHLAACVTDGDRGSRADAPREHLVGEAGQGLHTRILRRGGPGLDGA